LSKGGDALALLLLLRLRSIAGGEEPKKKTEPKRKEPMKAKKKTEDRR
jgi:hypothetical protein